MRRKCLIWSLVLALCLSTVAPALAANVFLFTEKNITVFEGASVQTALRREGNYAGDGEITYSSARTNVATVAEDGTITGVNKGQTEITASLMRNGKRVGQARATVKVLRAVQKVTLNTTRLSVYNPDDPAVTSLLREATDHQVLVIPAGTSVNLSTTCTPEDASNRQIAYTSSDAGVAKVTNTSLRAVQRGECDLTVASVQNPEVTETFRVLVIQPVKKITIDAGSKKVAAGSTLQLTANCSPDNASITNVTWTSKNPNIATVDEYGVVTGLKKGSANIVATAADGSKISATAFLTVTQSVTSITFAQDNIPVVAGRTVQAKIQILPAEANDRSVTWSSSDESIATVRGGQVTGKKAGTCTITCTSNSNPSVSASATVTVSQLVTRIEGLNSKDELSIKTGETVQLRVNVLPEDATDKSVTFKSLQSKIASVDENGLVTGLSRGTASITVTAKDASKRQATIRVNVIQPVTGVSVQKDLYYVQKGDGTSIKAVIEPKNANNQAVYWSSENEWIATVRSNGTSTGRVEGVNNGVTTVYTYTEDGGFSASTRIRVDNFNEAVMTEELDVNANNQIKITMRNMSQDITIENVHCKIECYDKSGNPMICNKDGQSTYFEADYPFVLQPLERSVHGGFRFHDYVIDQELGMVLLTITSWRDSEGITWYIPESEQIRTQWTRYNYYNNPDQGVG